MTKHGGEDDRRQHQRRRNWVTFGVLAAVALAFYLGIYWRWSHHSPVTQESTARAASHMGQY